MNLSQDFKEFIELLNVNHVKYLIIGGYAVSFHGHPRYTPNRIDLLTDLEDLNFEICYEKRAEIVKNGLKLCFLDKESLIQHKRFVGRLQDLADVENLTNNDGEM